MTNFEREAFQRGYRNQVLAMEKRAGWLDAALGPATKATGGVKNLFGKVKSVVGPAGDRLRSYKASTPGTPLFGTPASTGIPAAAPLVPPGTSKWQQGKDWVKANPVQAVGAGVGAGAVVSGIGTKGVMEGVFKDNVQNIATHLPEAAQGFQKFKYGDGLWGRVLMFLSQLFGGKDFNKNLGLEFGSWVKQNPYGMPSRFTNALPSAPVSTTPITN